MSAGLSRLAMAPTPGSCGVREPPGTAALVPSRSLAARVMTRRARAGAASVTLTAVAAAGKQHLRAAPRTREGGQNARPCSGLLGVKLPEAATPSRGHALRWTTAFGNATLAPHSLLACVGYGCGSAARLKAAAVLLRVRGAQDQVQGEAGDAPYNALHRPSLLYGWCGNPTITTMHRPIPFVRRPAMPLATLSRTSE